MSLVEKWRIAERSLDFLFPPSCALCSEQIAVASDRFCSACRLKLIPQPLVYCLKCGAPLGPYLRPARWCTFCYRERFAFHRAWSLGVFDGELRLAVLKAKSKAGENLSAALADLLYERHQEDWSVERPDLIVAVPHHWSERLLMKHHASRTIAQRLASRLNCELDTRSVYKRTRTPRQASLTATDRRKNLAGVFAVCGGGKLKGRRVLLVDDVLTTGTTAHRIASLIVREGGAAEVNVCVAARGVGHV